MVSYLPVDLNICLHINKKYFWWLTYIFTGLAVMAKGIPGFVIPAVTILVSTIIFKTYRETLRYLLVGIFLFLIIVLPWHILMLKTYPDLFFKEYIYKHHILRFLGSEVIHRSQPWYFYLLILLWGLFPHSFVLFPTILRGTKFAKPIITDNYSKLLALNLITVLVTLLFFSVSKTKLITYILPVYQFISILTADIWNKFIKNGDKVIKKSLFVMDLTFLLVAAALCFAGLVLPLFIYENFISVQLISIVLIVPFVVFNIWFIQQNKRFEIFISIILFISLLSGFLTPFIYKFDYSFGQSDLMKFAKLAKENNYTISTYKTGKKYSLLYYSNLKHVDFQIDDDLMWLDKELDKQNHLVITRNKDIGNLSVKIKIKGTKYSVIEK